MREISKAHRKLLRKLSQIAYDREMTHHLKELDQKFKKWQKKKISSYELNELIHNFHNGTSKNLYCIYNYLDADGVVARALAFGFLSEKEVPGELRSVIQGMISFYKEHDMD